MSAPSKGGRPLTGCPNWNPDAKRWEARVQLASGQRKVVPMADIPRCERTEGKPEKTCPCASCDRARHMAKLAAERAKKLGGVSAETAETANEWFKRYVEQREKLGYDTRGLLSSWERWVAPQLGTTPIADVSREHVIRLRNALTASTQTEGGISAKRAANLWSDLVRAPLGRAFTDDDPQYASLRVGASEANPTANVKPPVTKEQVEAGGRQRQALYPHEFSALMSCAAVPHRWRRIHALAAFLFVRPQEFYALRWTDVDWEAQEVRVRRKLDVRSGEEVPGTKSDAGIREVPIHPNLMPLLRAMHEEREDDSDRIVPLVGSARLFERFADKTKQHLRAAGIKRAELFTGTPDFLPFDFRSWRTTGCTWMAMLGTDSYVLASYAGHKTPDTTWTSYIKRGPDLRKRHGEPFPELPSDLLEPAPEGSGEFWQGFGFLASEAPVSPANLRRGRDSNPR